MCRSRCPRKPSPSGELLRRDQGHRRGVHSESWDRRHQVHRVPAHGLLIDARSKQSSPVADSTNQLLLLLDGKRCAPRGDAPEHPFGYGREALRLFAFIVSIVLFTVGGLFALYEGWHKLAASQNPSTAGGGCRSSFSCSPSGSQTYSFRTAIHESNQVRGELTRKQFVQRSQVPQLPGALLERPGRIDRAGPRAPGCQPDLADLRRHVGQLQGTVAIGLLLLLVADRAGGRDQEPVRSVKVPHPAAVLARIEAALLADDSGPAHHPHQDVASRS